MPNVGLKERVAGMAREDSNTIERGDLVKRFGYPTRAIAPNSRLLYGHSDLNPGRFWRKRGDAEQKGETGLASFRLTGNLNWHQP